MQARKRGNECQRENGDEDCECCVLQSTSSSAAMCVSEWMCAARGTTAAAAETTDDGRWMHEPEQHTHSHTAVRDSRRVVGENRRQPAKLMTGTGMTAPAHPPDHQMVCLSSPCRGRDWCPLLDTHPSSHLTPHFTRSEAIACAAKSAHAKSIIRTWTAINACSHLNFSQSSSVSCRKILDTKV